MVAPAFHLAECVAFLRRTLNERITQRLMSSLTQGRGSDVFTRTSAIERVIEGKLACCLTVSRIVRRLPKAPQAPTSAGSRYAEATGKLRDAVTGCIPLSAEVMRPLKRKTRPLRWRCVGTRSARIRRHETQAETVAVALR